MIKYIDISLPVMPYMHHWPGSEQVKIIKNHDLEEGDVATDSSIFMNLHTGTHVDAPSHFVHHGNTIDEVPLDVMLGSVLVIKIPGKVKEITADILSSIDIPENTERLLLQTSNSEIWRENDSQFYEDYTALVKDGAEWLVEKGIKLVGIDYLSIQRFADGSEVHQILLSSNIVIIEGLDLSDVDTGLYQLYCMPLKLQGLEAAPARVLLGYDATKVNEENA
jgi:arylformamidase